MEKTKLETVLTDKAFLEKIFKMEKIEEVQKAFLDKGIELSKEEIKVLGKTINKILNKGTTALSDEDLSDIAGGSGVLNTIGEYLPVISTIATVATVLGQTANATEKLYNIYKKGWN